MLAQQIGKQERGARWIENVVQYLQQHPDQNSELLAEAKAANQRIVEQRANPRRIVILGPSGVPRVALAADLVAAAGDSDPESTRSYPGPQLLVSPSSSINLADGVMPEHERHANLRSAVDSDYGVLLLTTPFIRDEQQLIQNYAASTQGRSIKSCALLLLDEHSFVHQTAVSNALDKVGIPLIAVARKQRFTELVVKLRLWLDPQLAASIYCPGALQTPGRRQGAANRAPPNDSGLLVGLRAKLDGIEADHIALTGRYNAFDSDADAEARAIADVHRQIQELDKKFSIAESRGKAQAQLLTKLEAAATDATGASDPDSLPYPAPKMKSKAGEVFDAGWQTYHASIRIGAVVNTDGLWLIREKDRDALVMRSQDNAFRWGDSAIQHWILGENSKPKAPRALHSEICEQIKANYLWVQRQWTQHQLRSNHLPEAPTNLFEDVKLALKQGIDTSTEAIANAGWAIVTGAVVGGAVGAVAGFAAVQYAIIPVATLAAPIAIGAGLVGGGLGYAYWAKKKRDGIIARVQTRLKEAVDAQRARIREKFCIAAEVEFNKFSRQVQDALHHENCVVKGELAALDKERKELKRHLDKLTGEREENKKQVKDRRRKLENDRDSLLALLNADYLKADGEKPR